MINSSEPYMEGPEDARVVLIQVSHPHIVEIDDLVQADRVGLMAVHALGLQGSIHHGYLVQRLLQDKHDLNRALAGIWN